VREFAGQVRRASRRAQDRARAGRRAARGFAHVGVFKALEAQGIVPDIIVGTSAGSVVAALYAGGANGFELQKLALSMEDGSMSDWVLPDRGFIRGEALQNFVNKALVNRPMNALPRKLAGGGDRVANRRNDGVAQRRRRPRGARFVERSGRLSAGGASAGGNSSTAGW